MVKRDTIAALAILLTSILWGCTEPSANSSQTEPSIQTDSIPFELTPANNIKFKAQLNGKDSLDLFFDTGGTELVLTFDAIRNRTSLLDDYEGEYVEEDYELLGDLNSLSMGGLSWDSLTVFPARIGPEGTDGHFGWDLFEGRIVELNYDAGVMVLHSSLPGLSSDYAKLDIEYTHTLFCIPGNLKVEGATFADRYLFDTGFQRAIVMDRELRAEENFPDSLPVIKEARLKNSKGTEFVNRVVLVDQICYGSACAKQVPVQLISTPNPARFKTHIAGNELLKRFNAVLDFQNGHVYLKANSLMDLPYADAS